MLKTYHIKTHIPGANTMSLIRFQPWQEVETMRRQLDQLFDEFVPMTRENIVNRLRVPAIELSATETHVILRAELPGFTAEDLDLEVKRDAITLKGELKPRETQEKIYRTELHTGSFHRVIALPLEVNHKEATAEFLNGILTVSLPKLAPEKEQAVKVAIGPQT
jgi:HSP20 family protein